MSVRQRTSTTEAARRALGALVAFAGGFLAYFIVQQPASTLALTIELLLTIGLASLIGALLWRTWWALLVAPVALWLGAVAAAIVFKALASVPVAGLGLGATVILALDLLLFFGLPAAVASAVGVAAGMRLDRRLSRRGWREQS